MLCARPIISATSVLGRGAIQRARLPVVDVAAHRADVDEVDAGLAGRVLRAARDVPRQAARVDLRVLQRQAAEGDDQLGVLCDLVPVRSRGVDRVGAAPDHVREDDLHGRAAVAVDRGGVAAVAVEEAVQQALRVMEAPGAAPAVGAAVDGGVAVLALDARELARGQVERLVPADLDEGVLSARRAARRPPASRGERRGAGCGPRGSARAACRCRSGDGSGSPAAGCRATTCVLAHLDVVVAPVRGRRRATRAMSPSPPGRRARPHGSHASLHGQLAPRSCRCRPERRMTMPTDAPSSFRRMRATACVCALLSVLLALPAAGAQADIEPLPKPAVVSPTPAGSNRGSLIAPVSKPVVSSIVKPDAPQVTTPPPVPATTARRPARRAHVELRRP